MDVLLGVTIEGGDEFYAEVKGQDGSKMINSGSFQRIFCKHEFFQNVNRCCIRKGSPISNRILR